MTSGAEPSAFPPGAPPAALLSFVLPLALGGTGRTGDDLERAQLLFRSFIAFYDLASLGEVVVVVRPDDRETISRGLSPFLAPCRVRIVNETRLCPELLVDPDTEHPFPAPNRGWMRQQLIKLAVHDQVETEFYCTLDADVLFVRPFSAATLVHDGRALTGVLTRAALEPLFAPAIVEESVQVREVRDANAESVLRVARSPERRDLWYGETPVVYSRTLLGEMAAHLERAWQRPWREVLLATRGWTEQSIYYLYAEWSGRLEKFHRLDGRDAVLRLGASLWHRPEEMLDRRSLATWDVDAAFDPLAEGVAVVVQSYLGHPPEAVAARIASHVPGI